MKRLLLLPLLLGCAPALSTFQPAHVAPKGHVTVQAGLDVSVPTGTIKDVLSAAKTTASAANGRKLSDEEVAQVFDAGVNLAVNPPSFGPHVNAAYVPTDRLEVGIRYASGGWRLGGRYQFLTVEYSGIDMTLGVGVARYTYKFPISDQIPFLKVEDFSRYQFDFPLLFGKSGDWYRWWAGPKVMLTTFSTEMKFEPPSGFGNATTLATFKGTGGYYAAQGGFALGWKKVFLGFELTLAQLFGHADTTILSAARKTSVNSFIIYPSLGLMGEF
jgi:hypothetical protein